MIRFICAAFLFLTVGCSLSFNEHNNVFAMAFISKEDECLKDLRVNVHLLTAYSPSRWYNAYKRTSVIENGQVLIPKIQEEGIIYYNIEARMPSCELSYHFSGDNAYVATDMNVNYQYAFSRDGIGLNWRIGREKGKAAIKYTDSSFAKPLPLYTDTADVYFFDGLSDNDIADIARLYTFEALIQEDKLLEDDIKRLPHLSDEQKQHLIKTHAQKEFNRINDSVAVPTYNSLP